MDSLTHTVLGACLGQVIAGKKIGKKALLWGALANNLPDVDVITGLWMSHADSLLAHRGFTHSFTFMILATPLLTWLFRNKFAAQGMRARDWFMIWGSGLLIHLLIDAMTAYGTAWYEPFHHHRVSFHVLFVADPFYTISLLVASIALLITGKTNRYRNHWAVYGLVISTLYVGYAAYNKAGIEKVVGENFRQQQISTVDHFSTPTPLNSFLWYIVARVDGGFMISYRSVFDESENMQFTFLPSQDSLLDAYRTEHEIKQLIRFSEGYYVIDRKNDTLQFNDLRFGQIGGWSDIKAPFVFRYALNEDQDNKMVIQQGRIEASSREGIRSLVERIKAD